MPDPQQQQLSEFRIGGNYRSITTHNHEALNREQGSLKELPLVRHIDQATIHENYFKIKQEVEELIEHEIEVLLNTPGFN